MISIKTLLQFRELTQSGLKCAKRNRVHCRLISDVVVVATVFETMAMAIFFRDIYRWVKMVGWLTSMKMVLREMG